jgi:hypothetical protein
MSTSDAPDPLLQLKTAGEQPILSETDKKPTGEISHSIIEGQVVDLSDLGTSNYNQPYNARYRKTHIVFIQSL